MIGGLVEVWSFLELHFIFGAKLMLENKNWDIPLLPQF